MTRFPGDDDDWWGENFSENDVARLEEITKRIPISDLMLLERVAELRIKLVLQRIEEVISHYKQFEDLS